MIGKIFHLTDTIAAGVAVSLAPDQRREDGLDGWWGEVRLTSDTAVLPGDRLTLELEDGRTFPIAVERVTVDTRASQLLVRFTGTGDTPV